MHHDIFELIRHRRSVFPESYTGEPISDETLWRILEAANWAPTHKKTEPWRFTVITGDARARLGDFLTGKYRETEVRPKSIKMRQLGEKPRKSAAVIVICMQRHPDSGLPEWEEVASVAMAVQNMWLCCTQLGIGAYWSSPGLIRYMGEFLELADNERCLGLFYMGHYKNGLPDQERGDIRDKVNWLS